MLPETKTYILEPVIDFSGNRDSFDKIVAASVENSCVNTLMIHAEPQYRTTNGMFALTRSNEPHDYTFIRHDLKRNEMLHTVIKDEYFNFHKVNFLPGNEILLICCRSVYKSETEVDRNARIYSSDGVFLRDFVAGDGIQDVNIDKDGNIWVSYFDEGIFGNYGWDGPIGASGLICWNKEGEKIWEYKPTAGLDTMADCYAMNIDSDNNIWCYYYTEFPLVKINSSKQIEFWETGTAGSGSLNISGNHILMGGGYDENKFTLFEINGRKLVESKKIIFDSDDGAPLSKYAYIPSLGAEIGFLADDKIYMVNMDEIK